MAEENGMSVKEEVVVGQCLYRGGKPKRSRSKWEFEKT